MVFLIKKINQLFAKVFLLTYFIVTKVLATSDSSSSTGTSPSGTSSSTSLLNPSGFSFSWAFTNIIKFLLGSAGSVAVIMVIISGLRYIIAQSPDEADIAKKSILGAIIGLIVVGAAYAIITEVLGVLSQ